MKIDIEVKMPPQKANFDEDEWALGLNLLDYLNWKQILSSPEDFAEHLLEELSMVVDHKDICEIAEFHYALYKKAKEILKEESCQITEKELDECFREYVIEILVKEEDLRADHPVALACVFGWQ